MKNIININLNGRDIETASGKTIFEVATDNGIKIPTLCHYHSLHPYSACRVCVVKIKGKSGFIPSCSTEICEGMDISTDTAEVLTARKIALELIMSDHFADCEPPCKIACPAQIDVQAYIAAIANGQIQQAVKIIKDNLPMPLSVGRVCPAFCEKECRRSLIDEPVAICSLKRYAADIDINGYWQMVPLKEVEKNKQVAIVGAGPSGLSCGYYLSYLGYAVEVFEANEKAGGWLRYGIPEFRLPKSILDKEIELMCQGGMQIHINKKLGRDITMSELSRKYAAVYLSIGASKGVDMPLKGSDLKGVYLGVDFLKSVAQTPDFKIGQKTAVIGGGNTAIDCARTAVRLGSEVTVIYRRTRNEMPAESHEIRAAEEEGVRFMLRSNPTKYIGTNKVEKIVVETIKLGEPDASGRSKPMPTGLYETYSFDTVIAAISQTPDIDFLNNELIKIPLTKWSTAQVDEYSMFTGIANIFAGGDFRRGPATVVEAIADGKRASESIDRFLSGCFTSTLTPLFDSKIAKSSRQISPEIYKLYPQIQRQKSAMIPLESQKSSFLEVDKGFTDMEATKEAERCIECGCFVKNYCKLRKHATDYDIKVTNPLFDGKITNQGQTHPFIQRNPNKCIKCGLCVRVCTEQLDISALGFINRGYNSLIAPPFEGELSTTNCEICGKCVTLCPTGALSPKNIHLKPTPS
ncbi:MAG: FAD-dependent oxidoreductase, partial [Candidatus Cloacimonetes bacterium]|nr:FAD-dependent oxidoreductase [Candidatus Cloacimonadota bacterium]